METYDVIVVGTGGVGSATLYQLAKRGIRVLGLDQFPPAHPHGSSHGQTRIIRQAYFEHPDYVPLLRRAYQLWRELEDESRATLFKAVGLLEVGPPDGVLIPGVMDSVQQHQLPIQTLTPAEARERYPFLIPADHQVVFEPTAGYLLVEDCVQTHLQRAQRAGALWRQETVTHWQARSGSVEIHTMSQRYAADRLVICGGAWSAKLLAGLGIPLRILAKLQYWLQAPAPIEGAADWPAFFFETSHGCYYGFPDVAGRGPKMARHTGGLPWSEPAPLEGVQSEADEQLLRRFLRETLPALSQLEFSSQACMYTLSPDEHFIVDLDPENPRVCFAAGLSGHGFKFTSVLGQVLTELALEGDSTLPIEFLSVDRFV